MFPDFQIPLGKEALNDYSEIIIQKFSAEGNKQNSYVKNIILFRIIHLLDESNDRTPQKMDDLTVILANAMKAMDKLDSDINTDIAVTYHLFVCQLGHKKTSSKRR